MIARGINKFGLATLATFGLLFFASSSVAWGLSSITRDVELSVLLIISWLGILAGWILAIRKIKFWGAILIAWLTSLLLLYFFFTRWITAILNTLYAINSTIIDNVRVSSKITGELPSLINVVKELGRTLLEPLNNLFTWLSTLLNGKAVYDPLITQVLWSIVVWLAALWAGYFMVRRREPLIALIPFGIILAGSLNFVRGEIVPLLLFIGMTLLLIPLMNYQRRKQMWLITHTDYAEDISLDISLITLPIIFMLLLIGTFIPNVSVKQIWQVGQKFYQTYAEKAENVGKLLGLETQPHVSNDFPILHSGGLPRQHLLGSGPELNEQMVMIIEVENLSFPQTIAQIDDPLRYYWRSIIYDQYTGKGWETSPTESIRYRKGEAILEDLPIGNQGFHLVIQDVLRIQNYADLIFTTGMVVKADHEYRVERRITNPADFDLFAGMIEAEEYRVESVINNVSDEQLRKANGNTPAWVADRYLQLPASLPERVRRLARDITQSRSTPYEKALAIESYLRLYPYSLLVGKPPSDRDVVDYFLFDLRQGYCDYYATTMVVLARTLGIPSRMVIGYASGNYDMDNGQYLITEADAHSWPELYFPGVGWVEFEPTGSRRLFQRPDWDSATIDAEGSIPNEKISIIDLIQSVTNNANFPIITILLLVVLGIIIWVSHDAIKLGIMAPPKSILTAFLMLRRQASSLTKPNFKGDTPSEFAEKLRTQLQQISGSQRVSNLFRKGSYEIQNLTDLYHLSAYSTQQMSKIEKDRSLHLWWRLHWRIRLAKLKYNLTNIIFLVIIRRIKNILNMEDK